jgi:hypothetical protein
VWSWPDLVDSAPAITSTNLEFVFWTSLSGFQIEKWTPLETNTPFFPQNTYPFFQQAVAHQYWRDKNDPDSPFTAELLISPTTSSPIAVLTMPSHREASLTTTKERQSATVPVPPTLTAAFVSIVETPRDLLSPVIPPGMGFALVRRDGSVLYHSDHARILNENLFLETENSSALVDAVATQSKRQVGGWYRGRDVAFYVRPLWEVDGVPWTIVVFHEIEPWQTMVWQVGLDVLWLYLLVWVVPVLLVPATMLWVKRRRDYTWSACRIEALRSLWPNDQSAGRYSIVVCIMCGLIVTYLVLLAWFGKRPDGSAGIVLLTAALLLPLVVLGACMRQVWRLNKPTGLAPATTLGRKSRKIYLAALCLMLIGSSVLPVTAFFHLAFRMESEIDIRHWQWDLTERVVNHRAAVEADVRRPERLSPSAVEVAMRMELPKAGDCDKEKLYESWNSTTVVCGVPTHIETAVVEPAALVPTSTKVLRFLRFAAIGLESDTVKVGDFPRGRRTGTSRPQLFSQSAETNVIVSSKLWDLVLLPRSLSWWIFAGILVAAGCVWTWIAASRLFLFDFYEIPLRDLKQLQYGNWNHPILVLGLPRSGKDHAVRDFIDALKAKWPRDTQETCKEGLYARLDLKTEKLDADWLRRAFDLMALGEFCMPPAVDCRTLSQSHRAVAAAASGEGGISSAAGSAPSEAAAVGRRVPDYVHVTNLEAAVEDRDRRYIAMSLLDNLVRAQAAGRLKLVVTSVVDPIFHYDIIFPDETNQVDRSHLPEIEFGRWSHLFLQFERVLVEEDQAKIESAKEKCGEGRWVNDLWEECKFHPSLRRTGQTISEGVRQRAKAGGSWPTHEQLVEELSEKAFALYKLLWSACTRPEKLLLVQLAQTGLVNPICRDTFQEMIRKKLVELKPYPRVMNESFARFLESAASTEQIEDWEKEAGESHWLTVRNVLLIMLAFAFLMIGISQDHALQSISAILTAVVGGIGGVFKLSDTIASKWGRKPDSAPASTPAAS